METDLGTKAVTIKAVARQLGELCAEKNAAYGDSFFQSGELLKLLYPDGVNVDQYQDLLAIARILDKLFRIARHKNAFDESPYRDIAGYGILGAVKEVLDANE